MMLAKLRAELPVLVRVTACAVLLVPTAWEGKVKELRERVSPGPVTVWPAACLLMEERRIKKKTEKMHLARRRAPRPSREFSRICLGMRRLLVAQERF
jgi:hypothetical protein